MPTISQLPVASAVNAGDLFVIVQSGVTKQVTDSLVISSFNLGTMAFVNSPAPSANGGTGVASPTAHTIPIAEGTSPFNFISLTNGQLLIGSTGADPVAANLIAGSGVSITNAPGSITIDSNASGLAWNSISGTTQAALVDTGYYCSNTSATTITLPAICALGQVVLVEGTASGGSNWILTANTGQTIQLGTSATSSGGTLTAANATDNIAVVCIVANTTWRVQRTNSSGLTIA